MTAEFLVWYSFGLGVVCKKPLKTSSSVVAERPRDVLRPAVVSLNSVIPRAQSFIIVTYLVAAYN